MKTFKEVNGMGNSKTAPPHFENSPPQKRSIPIIRYLVYLLIVTTTITGISLSKYSTSISGEDSAKVAKFDVDVSLVSTSPPLNNDLGPNTDYIAYDSGILSKTYTFTVTNHSEVSVRARAVAEHKYNPEGTYTVTTSSWVDFSPNNGNGPKNISVIVERPPLLNKSSILMNDVKIYVEYEQID